MRVGAHLFLFSHVTVFFDGVETLSRSNMRMHSIYRRRYFPHFLPSFGCSAADPWSPFEAALDAMAKCTLTSLRRLRLSWYTSVQTRPPLYSSGDVLSRGWFVAQAWGCVLDFRVRAWGVMRGSGEHVGTPHLSP